LYSANAITSTRGRADPKRREIYVLLAKLEWMFSLVSFYLYPTSHRSKCNTKEYFLNMINIYRVNILSDEWRARKLFSFS
jgi:hypothetical protein